MIEMFLINSDYEGLRAFIAGGDFQSLPLRAKLKVILDIEIARLKLAVERFRL